VIILNMGDRGFSNARIQWVGNNYVRDSSKIEQLFPGHKLRNCNKPLEEGGGKREGKLILAFPGGLWGGGERILFEKNEDSTE